MINRICRIAQVECAPALVSKPILLCFLPSSVEVIEKRPADVASSAGAVPGLAHLPTAWEVRDAAYPYFRAVFGDPHLMASLDGR
jgi:hypothetical protein